MSALHILVFQAHTSVCEIDTAKIDVQA
jgi:hypothetical protein